MLQDAPRNAAELQARMAQRDELAAQLRAVTEQRGHLGQERLNAIARQQAGAPAEGRLVAELDQRIRELGDRERKLENEKISADDAIADALARGVGVERSTRTEVSTVPAVSGREDVAPIHAMYRRMMGAEAVALLLLGVVAWRLLVRGVERRFARSNATAAQTMEKLQQAVDSIAIEVERVSENQRYVTKLLSEKQPALGQGPAQPIEMPDKTKASVRER